MPDYLIYAAVFALLIFFILYYRRTQIMILQRKRIRKRKGKVNNMNESAKMFVSKLCTVYVIDNEFTGTVKEVNDGALILEDKNGNVQLINLDYVVRIKQKNSDK